MNPNRHIIGIDLGSINDYTAACVVEQVFERTLDPRRPDRPAKLSFKEFRLLHQERYLGAPYTEICERLLSLQSRADLVKATAVVDGTGVGRPVVDMLKASGLSPIVPVIITGAISETSDFVNGLIEYRVPKRDLVGVLQVLLQNGELRIPATIPLKDELVSEMQNFKVKLNAETGHDTYEHWRSGDHDDLVLALAMACWYGRRRTTADWASVSRVGGSNRRY